MKNIFAVFVLLLASSAFSHNVTTSKGIEYPSYLLLVNDNEHGKIEVFCAEKKNGAGDISCNFEQTVVKHVDSKNLIDSLQDIHAKPESEIKKEVTAFCHLLDEDHGLQKRLEVNYTNAKGYLEKEFQLAFKSLCKNPSKANLTALKEVEISKNAATCKLFNQKYVQDYSYDSSSKIWIHKSKPDYSSSAHNCGFIDIGYLERDKRPDYKNWAWNYTTKKIVTNKRGFYLVGKCSDLTKGKDAVQHPVIYYSAFAQKAEYNQYLNCQYIDFSR